MGAYNRYKDKSLSGINLFAIGVIYDVSYITTDIDGYIDYIEASLLMFQQIEADVDGLHFTNEGKNAKTGILLNPKMVVKLTVASKLDADNMVKNLTDEVANGLVFIYVDNNKKAYLVGYPLDLIEVDREIHTFDYAFDTGENIQEEGKQLITLTFSATNISNILEFNETIRREIVDKNFSYIYYV